MRDVDGRNRRAADDAHAYATDRRVDLRPVELDGERVWFREPSHLGEQPERDWPTDRPINAQSMKKPPAVRRFR